MVGSFLYTSAKGTLASALAVELHRQRGLTSAAKRLARRRRHPLDDVGDRRLVVTPYGQQHLVTEAKVERDRVGVDEVQAVDEQVDRHAGLSAAGATLV